MAIGGGIVNEIQSDLSIKNTQNTEKAQRNPYYEAILVLGKEEQGHPVENLQVFQSYLSKSLPCFLPLSRFNFLGKTFAENRKKTTNHMKINLSPNC
jgi:hypothetical protein